MVRNRIAWELWSQKTNSVGSVPALKNNIWQNKREDVWVCLNGARNEPVDGKGWGWPRKDNLGGKHGLQTGSQKRVSQALQKMCSQAHIIYTTQGRLFLAQMHTHTIWQNYFQKSVWNEAWNKILGSQCRRNKCSVLGCSYPSPDEVLLCYNATKK